MRSLQVGTCAAKRLPVRLASRSALSPSRPHGPSRPQLLPQPCHPPSRQTRCLSSTPPRTGRFEDFLRDRLRQELQRRAASRQRPHDASNTYPGAIKTTAREVASEPLPITAYIISPRYIVAVVLATSLFYYAFSYTVPVTGRSVFNVVPDSWVAFWSAGTKSDIINDVHRQGGRFLPERDPRTRSVKKVMRRLIPYSGTEDLDWEIFVIEDPRTANAFVVPGGKVFVHSGLLEVCENESALAAVLGHEIAHNTASHSGERISLYGALTVGTSCSLLAFGGWGTFLVGGLLWNALGLYFLHDMLLFLPMSRAQETEADYVGLMMLAQACFDPRASVRFWERMQALQHGKEPPEVLSTHPATALRVDNLQKWMPQALERRAESDCQGTASYAHRFREAIHRGTPRVLV